MLRANRIFKKEERNKNQSELSSTTMIEIQPQQPASSINSGMVAPQYHQSGLTVVTGKLTSQTCGSGSLFDLEKPTIMCQQSDFLAEPWQLAIQPQLSRLSVAPIEKMIQLPEQPGFCPNFRTRSSQSECPYIHIWNSYPNQILHDSVKSGGIQEDRLQHGDKFHLNSKHPNFDMNRYWNCINDKSMTIGKNKLPERNSHRQQLRSINHCHPATLPQRQVFHSQQLCQYHAQGRCYY